MPTLENVYQVTIMTENRDENEADEEQGAMLDELTFDWKLIARY
jgi:hypothetical protein